MESKTYTFIPAREYKDVRKRSYLISVGHGAFGEPDNSYGTKYEIMIDYKYVEVQSYQYIVLNQDGTIVGIIDDYNLPNIIRGDIDPSFNDLQLQNRKLKYEELKKEFEKK